MSMVNGVDHDTGPAPHPLFPEIDPDDPANETTQIESLCVACQENGITKLLLTKIPFYKEVVLLSFECPHCGFSNNEIQSAGKIEEKGMRVILHIETVNDLNRQVIKSDYAAVKLPHLDFEIPSQSQKGEVTTVEGIISRAVQGLSQDQDARRATDLEVADKIQDFINKLEALKDVSEPFDIIIEDISGNSWIENPKAPQPDPNCKTSHFVRNRDQDHILGVYTTEEIEENEEDTSANIKDKGDESLLPPLGSAPLLDLEQEVMIFQTNCPSCSAPTTTNMKVTKIPFFKEVIIMATNCDSCGHRTNEVKSGAGIEEKGVKMEVVVSTRDDFSRDLLKSETCSVLIPELELEAGPYVVGGKFTTVEGLLTDLKFSLEKSVMSRDTLKEEVIVSLNNIVARIDKVLVNEESVTLVLDDPAGNSYIQSLTAPDPDPSLKITRYERTFDQNEDLGLNDMKTEDY
uniref:Zinc finger protein n=1 Tax=Riptortus pedestris TaxID=329032 RepID=R4WK33_RIPPE|nr:zinc finger protein [Riptortus pedestris]